MDHKLIPIPTAPMRPRCPAVGIHPRHAPAFHAAGITLFDLNDPRQGIVRMVSPEQGIVQPG